VDAAQVTQKYKDETEESLDADRGLSKRRIQIEVCVRYVLRLDF
jgi:hypothetical protein